MPFIRIGSMTLNLDYVVRIVEHRRPEAQVAAGHYPAYYTVYLTSGERFQFVGGEALALEAAMDEHVKRYDVPHELPQEPAALGGP
jgi:hypothetical protein